MLGIGAKLLCLLVEFIGALAANFVKVTFLLLLGDAVCRLLREYGRMLRPVGAGTLSDLFGRDIEEFLGFANSCPGLFIHYRGQVWMVRHIVDHIHLSLVEWPPFDRILVNTVHLLQIVSNFLLFKLRDRS